MIQMPYTPLGLTRFEFDGSGIAFRIWTRPVVSDGGRAVAPVTLLWRHPDGTAGKRPCSGFVEATEYAARVVADAAMGTVLTR
ncbi:hypothetical protein [Roseomonas elaeocarpi]|uniref:Uncharacterized protein n=1 Tax=Roseomonas elaeocarpi TaxID=907779 RepID=A0ABV6JWK2_9PROT